jgi:hypothetical protein
MFERLKVAYVVKEVPMIEKVFAWLMDPKAPGRKRGLAATLFVLAELARASDGIIARACEKALLVGAVCSLHVAAYATWLDVAYQGVQQFLVPGAEVVGTLVGIWGLIHAAQRNHVVTPLQ